MRVTFVKAARVAVDGLGYDVRDVEAGDVIECVAGASFVRDGIATEAPEGESAPLSGSSPGEAIGHTDRRAKAATTTQKTRKQRAPKDKAIESAPENQGAGDDQTIVAIRVESEN